MFFSSLVTIRKRPQILDFLFYLALAQLGSLATSMIFASFSALLSLHISQLTLPGFGWGGKGNNVRDSICSPFHTLRYQEGLEVA